MPKGFHRFELLQYNYVKHIYFYIWRHVCLPLKRKAIVLSAVPVEAGSCIASFAATVKPMVSSSVLFAVAIAPPERFNDSPSPVELILNLFFLLLSAFAY